MKVDWLDRLTFREIELINEKEKRDSNFMYLMIEFPRVKYEQIGFTVVYFEKVSIVVWDWLIPIWVTYANQSPVS